MNLVVIKTLAGTSGFVSTVVGQLSIPQVLGCTYGDDTVMVISGDPEDAKMVQGKLLEMIEQ